MSEYFSPKLLFAKISVILGDLTHVAFGYDGYIRLTVRPQHQVGRLFFFFFWNSESVSKTSAHAFATVLLIARKLNVATCLPGYYFLSM